MRFSLFLTQQQSFEPTIQYCGTSSCIQKKCSLGQVECRISPQKSRAAFYSRFSPEFCLNL